MKEIFFLGTFAIHVSWTSSAPLTFEVFLVEVFCALAVFWIVDCHIIGGFLYIDFLRYETLRNLVEWREMLLGHIVREKMEKWWFWIQFYIVLLWWQKYSEISLLKNYQTTDKIILDSGKLSLLSVDIVKRCPKPWVTSYTTSPSCIQILVMRKRRIAMKLCRHASTE